MNATLDRTLARPGVFLSQIGGLPPVKGQKPALKVKLEAAKPLQAVAPGDSASTSQSDAVNKVNNLSPSLAAILRPQAAYRWLMPGLAAITPLYVENVLRGALAGNHVQAWELFDLILDTNPEAAACVGEYVDGILEKKLIVEPYHGEDEEPTSNAIRNQKMVSAGLRNMRPDPANDENSLNGTVRDILFGRFHGQSVMEEDWYDTYGTGQLNRINVPGVGNIVAPRCTFWVHPVCYAWDLTGRLGLRVALDNQIREITNTARAQGRMGAAPSGAGMVEPPVWNFISSQPMPSYLTDFPKNKFLIAILKAKSGTALSASCLRSLAWWWVVANFCGDWLLDLAQLFGIPFRKAKYEQGTPEPEKAEARQMLQDMGSRGWCLLDERVNVEFEKAMDNGAASPQGFMIELAHRQMRKVILRQTMTGQDESTGKGFGDGELGVKGQCLNAGAKFVCEVLREQMARHILMVNNGNDEDLPFISMLDDDEGGLEEAQTIQALATAGAGSIIPLPWIAKRFNIPQAATGEKTLADVAPPPEPDPVAGKPGTPAPKTPTPGPKAPVKKPAVEAHELAAEAIAPAKDDSAIVQKAAAAMVDMAAPLVKYLKAGLKIDDEPAQRAYFERALEKWPELTAPLQHDPTLSDALAPALVKTFADGLYAKRIAPDELMAGDVAGHEFHGNQFSDAVGKIKAVSSGKEEEAAYAKVHPTVAVKIKAATGMDVSDHYHYIDRGGMVHIIREHGVGFEKQESQEPVTKEDFHKIPEIVANPDTVEKGKVTSRGHTAIVYSKKFGDSQTTHYVEEHWSKQKLLAAKTMYKKKAPGNSATPGGGGVSHTSKTSGTQPKDNPAP